MVSELIGISGIGPATVKLLEQHGVETIEDLIAMDEEQLRSIPGFGASRAAKILASAGEIIEAEEMTEEPADEVFPEGEAGKKEKKKKKKSKKDKPAKKKKEKKTKKKAVKDTKKPKDGKKKKGKTKKR